MKKLFLFTLALALLSSKPAFNQEAYKLNLNQLPPLIITVSEELNATVGQVVNLDTLFHVEGDNPYSREWKFWNGNLLQAITNPVITISSNGIFYLTIINGNGCQATDSITLKILTDIEEIYTDRDNHLSIRIYPNPNTGTFDLIISECKPGFYIEIINSLGVQFLSKALDCNYNEYSGTIMMPNSQSGTYFLLIKNGHNIIYRQKVIILK